MSLFNASRWNSVLFGGGAASASQGALNITTVIDALLPALHADSRADLTFWNESDLINWMDEGLKRLTKVCGVFVEIDASNTTSNGLATYPLPERHDATLYVSLGTAPLRPASMIELEMRDAGFQTTAGTPDHWYEDGQAWNVGLSPVPSFASGSAGKVLSLIMTAWPPTLDTGKQNVLVQAPAPLAGYLTMYVLAKAYGREGESEMPDVAQHCQARCQMYEEIFAKYYGAGL